MIDPFVVGHTLFRKSGRHAGRILFGQTRRAVAIAQDLVVRNIGIDAVQPQQRQRQGGDNAAQVAVLGRLYVQNLARDPVQIGAVAGLAGKVELLAFALVGAVIAIFGLVVFRAFVGLVEFWTFVRLRTFVSFRTLVGFGTFAGFVVLVTFSVSLVGFTWLFLVVLDQQHRAIRDLDIRDGRCGLCRRGKAGACHGDGRSECEEVFHFDFAPFFKTSISLRVCAASSTSCASPRKRPRWRTGAISSRMILATINSGTATIMPITDQM